MGLTFTMKLTGTEQVLATLKALGDDAEPAMQAALVHDALELLEESDKLVPRDFGTLAGSKYVEEAPLVVTAGYGGAACAYALSVHENPRSGQTGGFSPSGKPYKTWAQVGQWKWLEEPFKARTAGFDDRVGAFLRKRLLKGG